MWLAAFLGGYTLGAIPFGILIAKLMGLGDLRSIGSGNIGATNVLRTGNKGAAAATLIFDAGKGAVAVLITTAVWGETAGLFAGLGAFLGHLYPVWLTFKGGKGVATFLGILLAINFSCHGHPQPHLILKRIGRRRHLADLALGVWRAPCSMAGTGDVGTDLGQAQAQHPTPSEGRRAAHWQEVTALFSQ